MDVGRELREAREGRGLSLERLAATTRVRTRVLDAIERNDQAALPARPYARGFVASYAREVGLDPARITSRYFAQFEPVVEEHPAPAEPPVRVVPVDDDTRPRWVPVAAIMIVAIGAVLWLRQADEVRPTEPRPVGTSGTAAPVAVPAAPVPASPPIMKTSAPAAAAASKEIVVRLEATRPVWVSATADGTRVVYRLLQPGTSETVRALSDVGLRVGDAGAITMVLNGREPTVLGQPGEVRNLRITSTGVESH